MKINIWKISRSTDLLSVSIQSFSHLNVSSCFILLSWFTSPVNYCSLAGLWSVHICACIRLLGLLLWPSVSPHLIVFWNLLVVIFWSGLLWCDYFCKKCLMLSLWMCTVHCTEWLLYFNIFTSMLSITKFQNGPESEDIINIKDCQVI